MSIFRAFINNPINEIFYRKKKKINILTAFFIFHKNDIKTFFKIDY